MSQLPATFWSVPAVELLQRLQTSSRGLTNGEAKQRLKRLGANRLKPKRRTDALTLLLAQFKSPIILLLLFSAGLSFLLGETTDALIIVIIVLVSSLLQFWQERGATDAVEKLLALIQTKAVALRDGRPQQIPVEDIVPGDVVMLSAGAAIPGDCLILESKDLFVDEATLTGETYPTEKMVGVLPADTPLSHRTNSLFQGTHVVSGSSTSVVARTGRDTEFGQVSERLALRPPETEFERGIRQLGYLLMEVTFILVIIIFAINVYFKRPTLDSFLFALALAVGLTPQMLPAIISITLAQGAKRMAQDKVIVKRLESIEDFGSMNVLCSDKTGTLTEGKVELHSALDVEGHPSEKVLLYAYLNAAYESGYANPIDLAIRAHRQFDLASYRRLDEVPYDFVRKRLSILVAKGNEHLLITKGAVANVLAVCLSAELGHNAIVDIKAARGRIEQRYEQLTGQGFRTLGLACRNVGSASRITRADETQMTFLGFIVLTDPPKSDVVETIKQLAQLGISLKIITGDNARVVAHVSKLVGMSNPQVLSGSDLHHLSDEALLKRVNEVNIFAEVEPNQKERIILALKKSGNVVGCIGDGINDASALHAADVGISVESAVDVAKEAADIVLLEKDLQVLVQGVRQGRTTFANTLKYVFITIGANFGNMFSTAGASLFLPFLPLLPKQILLTNLVTDIPATTIATDSVDRELVYKPRRWNVRFIRDFMIVFGIHSSVFDFLTFGALLFVLHTTTDEFRTGWFVESVISEILMLLVIRTQRPFFGSRPGRYLLLSSLFVIILALVIPYAAFNELLGFTTVSLTSFLLIGVILVLYISTAEILKRAFYQRERI